MNKTRIIRFFIFFLIGIGVASAITVFQIKNEKLETSVVSSHFGGPFTLNNHLGERVTEEDFKDQYRLIYFGFTYCPAICPTELQRITTVLKGLGTTGDNIHPIFITVDPERDTVETMKHYVELFHPRLTGLTGTVDEINVIKKAYKIYAAKAQEENMNDYTMDHSSFIYFMGPEDTLIHIFKMDDPIENIVRTIQDKIKF